MKALSTRAGDIALAGVAVAFSLTSFTIDLVLALGIPLAADSDSTLSRLCFDCYAYADAMLLDPPPFLRIQAAICCFVYGPFYLVLAYALVRGRAWIRVPALVYSGMALNTMSLVLGLHAMRHYEPLDNTVWALGTLPYAAFPLILIWRFARSKATRA